MGYKLNIAILFFNSIGCATAALPEVSCPVYAEQMIMFIDTCPSKLADVNTELGTGLCMNMHSEEVIKVYKKAGGKRKIWLVSMYHNAKYRDHSYEWGIRAATKCKVPVINISGGGEGYDSAEEQAINTYLLAEGTIYASAGNKGIDLNKTPFYPCMYNGVTCVGGKDCVGHNAYFSNYGKKYMKWACDHSVLLNSFGSSFAAPRVSAMEEE